MGRVLFLQHPADLRVPAGPVVVVGLLLLLLLVVVVVVVSVVVVVVLVGVMVVHLGLQVMMRLGYYEHSLKQFDL